MEIGYIFFLTNISKAKKWCFNIFFRTVIRLFYALLENLTDGAIAKPYVT